jgi:hypothetical protein
MENGRCRPRKRGCPALLNVGLRPAETVHDEIRQPLLRAFPIIRRIHRPDQVIPPHPPVKRRHHATQLRFAHTAKKSRDFVHAPSISNRVRLKSRSPRFFRLKRSATAHATQPRMGASRASIHAGHGKKRSLIPRSRRTPSRRMSMHGRCIASGWLSDYSRGYSLLLHDHKRLRGQTARLIAQFDLVAAGFEDGEGVSAFRLKFERRTLQRG